MIGLSAHRGRPLELCRLRRYEFKGSPGPAFPLEHADTLAA
jgi:hypothetical protein